MQLRQVKYKTIAKNLRNILKGERPIRTLIGISLMMAGVSKFFTIRRGTYSVRFFPTALSLQFFVCQASRREEEEVIQRVLREGDVFVDIGSNIGNIAIRASKCVGKSGLVISCEPHPTICEYQKKNISLNSANNIQLVNAGVGRVRGNAVLSDRGADDQNCISNVESGVKIDVLTLDEIVGNHAEIAFLKIDTEGYEKQVLEGGVHALSITKIVQIELWEQHAAKYNYRCCEIVETLKNAGFELFIYVHGRPVTIESRLPFVATECVDLYGFRSGKMLLQDFC
jgi:FkbM family methyltransferase